MNANSRSGVEEKIQHRETAGTFKARVQRKLPGTNKSKGIDWS